jgi:anti-sigma regulatory factor (Ser/Thr protein kinase)
MRARDKTLERRLGRYSHMTKLHLLELPPVLQSLADLRAFIDAIPLADALTEERIFDLKVAASEAAANAIEHAQAKVSIGLWLLDDRVVVDVGNVGEFGSRMDEQPTRGRRGFGLKLMVCLANEVTFNRGKEGKTNVRLTFLRNRYEVPGLPAEPQEQRG